MPDLFLAYQQHLSFRYLPESSIAHATPTKTRSSRRARVCWFRPGLETNPGKQHSCMVKTPAFILGILALLIGLLWIGQGTGYVAWPQSSFMISQIQWAWYGAALAVVGAVLIGRGRFCLSRQGRACPGRPRL